MSTALPSSRLSETSSRKSSRLVRHDGPLVNSCWLSLNNFTRSQMSQYFSITLQINYRSYRLTGLVMLAYLVTSFSLLEQCMGWLMHLSSLVALLQSSVIHKEHITLEQYREHTRTYDVQCISRLMYDLRPYIRGLMNCMLRCICVSTQSNEHRRLSDTGSCRLMSMTLMLMSVIPDVTETIIQ